MSSQCVSSYQPIATLTDLPLTFDLVLNPAIHLAWIQAQWETEYVQHLETVAQHKVQQTRSNAHLV